MTSEITATDSMFVTRQPAWHGLGKVLQNPPTSADALHAAGLSWKVGQSPVQWMDANGTLQVDDSHKCNYRDDTGELLGVVSRCYRIVQNTEAFAFTDNLVGEGVQYETVGSLKGGRLVWLLARMPERKILQDAYNPYLLFVNGHDGLTAVNVCMTPVRVVCWNTLNLALSTAKQRWTLCHTKHITSRLEMAQSTLKSAVTYMSALESRAESLASIRLIGEYRWNACIERLFPKPDTDLKKRRNDESITRFRQCYEAPDLDNVRGTAYGFLMAVSDYASHREFRNEKQRVQHFMRTVMQPSDMLMVAASLFAT